MDMRAPDSEVEKWDEPLKDLG